ncbi:sensor histidine kinase [Streptomyces sp. Ru71]|uniref:sensor histidine kinase n=1 Tax=Streptomyces sp. Ru71 TaxID=2080746 RepID=UPI0015E3A606|nr:sensor histidine kinase [Streptomyces sp. Ru71]
MTSSPTVRRTAVDAALAVGVAVTACVAGRQYHPAGWAPFDARAYLLACLAAAPLSARRLAPVWTLLASNAAYAVYLALGYQPTVGWWTPAIALLSLAAQRPLRQAVPGTLVTAAGILYSGLAAHLAFSLALAQALLVPPVALYLGHTQRRLAQRGEELKRLAAKLAREQEERARRAVLDERLHIARELHDVVAHHMSVITLQAGLAGYVFDNDPPTARQALATIGTAGREALDDLRRMLTVLRAEPDEPGADAKEPGATGPAPEDYGALGPAPEDPGPPGPAPEDPGATGGGGGSLVPAQAGSLPRLERVGELARRMSTAGMTVDVVTEGTPRRLPPGLELCAYRVVQEALTNAAKHTVAARVGVRLAYLPERLDIVVRDDGGRGKPADPATGSGHGLIGMQERVRICGGRLSAGALPEGGFEVRLTLPTGAALSAG